jgi:hypothetical protein
LEFWQHGVSANGREEHIRGSEYLEDEFEDHGYVVSWRRRGPGPVAPG